MKIVSWTSATIAAVRTNRIGMFLLLLLPCSVMILALHDAVLSPDVSGWPFCDRQTAIAIAILAGVQMILVCILPRSPQMILFAVCSVLIMLPSCEIVFLPDNSGLVLPVYRKALANPVVISAKSLSDTDLPGEMRHRAMVLIAAGGDGGVRRADASIFNLEEELIDGDQCALADETLRFSSLGRAADHGSMFGIQGEMLCRGTVVRSARVFGDENEILHAFAPAFATIRQRVKDDAIVATRKADAIAASHSFKEPSLGKAPEDGSVLDDDGRPGKKQAL